MSFYRVKRLIIPVLLVLIWMPDAVFAQANPTLDSLEAVLQSQTARDTPRVKTLLEISYLTERAAPGKSVLSALEAMEISAESGSKLWEAKAASQVGNAYGMTGSTPKQRDYYHRALEIARGLENQKLQADLLNNLGTVENNDANFDLGNRYLKDALALYMKIGVDKNLPAVYNNLGNGFGWQDRFDSALVYFQLAYDLLTPGENPMVESIILGNIGSALGENGKFEESYKILHQTIRLKAKINDLYGISQLNYNMGNTYLDQGSLDSAQKYFDRALAIADTLPAPELQKISHRDLTDLYQRKGDFKKALEHAQKALVLQDTLWNLEASGIAEMTELRLEAEKKVAEREFEAEALAIETAARDKRQKIQLVGALIVIALVIVLLVVVFRRYRERRQAADVLEAKVRQRTSELSETNKKLEAAIEATRRSRADLNTFIYRSSHDLKSPLSSIMGLCDISKSMISDPQAAEYLGMIAERAAHLDRQLQQLIEQVDVLEKAPGLQSVKLNDLIANARKAVEGYAPGVSLAISVTENSADTISTDPDLMGIVLRNLLRNALDFRKEENQAEVHISVDPMKDGWQMKVKDEGIGMTDKVKAKAFEMFYRGSEKSRGAGLGLYAVRNIVNLLEGEIRLESEEGGGTTVVMGFSDK